MRRLNCQKFQNFQKKYISMRGELKCIYFKVKIKIAQKKKIKQIIIMYIQIQKNTTESSETERKHLCI